MNTRRPRQAVQDREVRLYTDRRIDGEHTLVERQRLYSQKLIPRLQYRSSSVPVVPCRNCLQPRLDDGTECSLCGAYQHCTIVAPPAGGSVNAVVIAESIVRSFGKPSGKKPKPINPRRRKSHEQ